MKKTLLLLLNLPLLLFSQIETGDIQFVGFNADGNDSFAIVSLEDISPNSTFYFTDNQWNGNSLTSSEGEITWNTGTMPINAGTFITFYNTSSTPVSNYGTASGKLSLSGTSESILMFIGANETTPTKFISGISNANDSYGVLLNTNLELGTSVVVLNSGTDIGSYSGVRTGKTKIEFINQIHDLQNWTLQNGTGDQSNDQIAPDEPYDITAFSITNEIILGLDNHQKGISNFIYPNPVKSGDRLYLNTNDEVMIYDINGRQVEVFNNKNAHDVDLKPGIYFVRFENQSYKLLVQ